MKRVLQVGVLGWLFVLASALALAEAGLRLNVSPSVPRGIYWLTRATPKAGAYVAVCPPRSPLFDAARDRGYLQHGRCAGDYAEMIKVLAALPGDQVRIGRDGVHVRERLWPNSLPLSADAAGRPLPGPPSLAEELGPRSVLVMSESCELGFDSRYFGPLPESAVKATAIRLLAW